MPLFDKTGPSGQGPMTGRGAGYCNLPPYLAPRFSQKTLPAYGRMRGLRRFRGFRRR